MKVQLPRWRAFTLFSLIFLGIAAPNGYANTLPSLKLFTMMYQENLQRLRQKTSTDKQDPCWSSKDFSHAEDMRMISHEISLAEFCATQSSFSFYKITSELQKNKVSKKTLDYVLYRGRRYIVDGHHHYLLALYNGLETMPARMVAQFDDRMSPEDFIEELQKQNMIYDQLIDPMDMVDNIYLNKVRELIRDTTIENNKLILKGKNRWGEMIGALAPLKPYYAELELAGVLKDSGYVLKNITAQKLIEVFQKAKKIGDPRVADLILFDTPFQITDRKTFEKAQGYSRAKFKRHLKQNCNQILQKPQPGKNKN